MCTKMHYRKLLLMIAIATTVIHANGLRIDSNVELSKTSESADNPNAEALTLVIHKYPSLSNLQPVQLIERSDNDDVVVIRSNRPKRRPQTRKRRPTQFRSKIKHPAKGGSSSSFGGFKDGSKDYGSPRFPPFPTIQYGERPRASNKYKRGPKPHDSYHSHAQSTKYVNKRSKKKPTTAYGPPTSSFYGPPSSNFQQVDPPFIQEADTFNEQPLQTLQQQHNNFPSYAIDTVHSANNFFDSETEKVKESFNKYHRDLAAKYPNLNGNLHRDNVGTFQEPQNFHHDSDKYAPPLNNFPLEAGSSFNSQKTSYGYPVRNQATPTLSFNPNIVANLNNHKSNQNTNQNRNSNQHFDQNLNPESEQYGNYESSINHYVDHNPEPEQYSEPNSNQFRNQNQNSNSNHNFRPNQNSNQNQNFKAKPQQNPFSNHNMNSVANDSYNINFNSNPNQNSQSSNSNFPKLPSRYEQTDFSTPTRMNPNQNQYMTDFQGFNNVAESQPAQNKVPNRPNSVFNKFNNFDYDFGTNKDFQNSAPDETEEDEDENVDFIFSDSRNTRGRQTTSTTTTTTEPSTTRRPKFGKRKRPVKVSQNHNLDTEDLRDAFTESSDIHAVNADFHEISQSPDDYMSPFDSQRKKKRKQNQYLHEIPSTLKTARSEQEALRTALGDDFQLVSVHKSIEKNPADDDPFGFQRKNDDSVVSSDLSLGEVAPPDLSSQASSFWNGDFNNFPRNHHFV